MAKPKIRGRQIIIVTIVAAFLLSSLGFTGLVIWDMTRNKSNSSQDLQDQVDQLSEEQKEGQLEGTQLSGFQPTDSVGQLQIIDLEEGSGAEVKGSSTVTAHYTGALAKTGVIFQSSHDSGQPFTAALSGVIEGWQKGMPGMKAGGKRRIIIPAEMAYGNQAVGNIPANSPLVFDIELISIEQ